MAVNPVSWLNAFVLSIEAAPQLADDIVRSAARLCGVAFRRELLDRVRSQDPAFPADEFLRLVDAELEPQESPDREGFLMRLYTDAGKAGEFSIEPHTGFL